MVEEQASQAIIKEVFTVLGITEAEFKHTYRKLSSSPKTAGLVDVAEQCISTSEEQDKLPSLSKEKLLEVLEVHMEFDIKAE